LQGIDLVAGGRNTKKHRTAPKSDNVYLKLLVKVRAAVAQLGLRHGSCTWRTM
jgi:large subunit ribosomal protein L18e